MLLGNGLQRELEGDRVVRGLERVGVLEVDLMLAGGDLVVGGLHADPERLERVDHVLAHFLGEIGREVEVAGLIVGQRLDRPVGSAAEQEELQLGTHVDDVAELARPLDLAAEDPARIADERLAARREDIADDTGGPARAGTALPRDLGEGRHVRHEVLIALGDPGESLDRRAIEPGPVGHGALELVNRDRDRLDVPDDVRELELDEPDTACRGVPDPGDRIRVLGRHRATRDVIGRGSVLEQQFAVLRQRPEIVRDHGLQRVGRGPERRLGGDHVLDDRRRLALDRFGLMGRVQRMLEGLRSPR